MIQKLTKLIDVKSIVTLSFTAVFCYLAIVGKVNAEQFISLYTMIIGFYFGTQYAKRNDKGDNDNE